MTQQLERPTPREASAALDSIGDMTRAAVKRGLRPRWFAASLSLWVGATTVAKAYNGPIADAATAALVVGGFLGLALWRSRIVARVRAVYGAVGTVAAVAMIIAVLAILLVGDRAFEVYDVSWAPLATGGVVAAVLFLAFEVERRATSARLAARNV
jgi:hypothetical protein